MPLVVAISLVGVFALRGNAADAWVALFFGVVGFAMLRAGYPLAPAVLGLILGPMIETNYRRGPLTLSSGSHTVFLESRSAWCCSRWRWSASRPRRSGTVSFPQNDKQRSKSERDTRGHRLHPRNEHQGLPGGGC